MHPPATIVCGDPRNIPQPVTAMLALTYARLMDVSFHHPRTSMRTALRFLTTACVLAPSLALLISCGAAEAPPATKTDLTVLAAPGVPGGVIRTNTTIQSRVVAKDEAKRTLTLLGADKS